MIIKKIMVGLLISTMVLAVGCGNQEKTDEKKYSESNTTDTLEESSESQDAQDAIDTQDTTDASKTNIGQFSTTDIFGETVTQDIFAEYDLTLVNLFATWCGPCVQEMPELAQLQKDMRDKGVNVVAVVLDAAVNGVVDENAVDAAKEIVEMAEAEFTFMIPDATNLNGRLDDVTAVPESFFVDKEGNIVGEPYVGARSYDDWKAIIEEIRKNR
ncbi:MAG: TlpA family protein disulfide reductase [Lachnospiraceae bacterium]|nr:TlpA family protein disulfide reductase [Lachnospiraceae bacterium]